MCSNYKYPFATPPKTHTHTPPKTPWIRSRHSGANPDYIDPTRYLKRTCACKSLQKVEEGDLRHILSVKDLGARRVFSPKSTPENQDSQSPNPNLEVIICSSSSENEESNGLKNVSPSLENIRAGMDEIKRNDDVARFVRSLYSTSAKPVAKRKKLYKAPYSYSFSYRRLLPYLMAVDNHDDDACLPKVEVVDVELPCKSWNCGSSKECDVADKFEETREVDKKAGQDVEIAEIGTWNLIGESSNLSGAEGNMELPDGELRYNDGGKDNGLDELMAECDQATPPDAVIVGKLELDEAVACNVSQNEMTVGKDGGIAEGFGDKKHASNSKCAKVLNPCSRMKVFKTPSSVSYRRLLPFLLDMEKDNLHASTINPCPTPKKDLDPKLPTLVLVFSPNDILVDKSEMELNSEQQYLGFNGSSLLKPTVNSDVPVAESKQSSPASMLASCNGEKSKELLVFSSQSEHVTSDGPTRMEHETSLTILNNSHQVGLTHLCSPTNHGNFPRDDAKLIQVNSKKDYSELLAGLCNHEIKLTEVGGFQNSFQMNGCDSSGVIVGGLRKGILRKNPRGCRGLCNCLNCAAFHLQAQRAFEFSRNQMLDAEEVALELIRELTDIRSVLEKSVVDAHTQVVLQGDQVKEACKKALATEELAKKRLSQMNEDISYHCRNKSLERPRVSFANNVEEKNI